MFYDPKHERCKMYSEKLAQKPQIVVANKADIPQFEENFEVFKTELENRGYFYSVSGLGSFVAAPSDIQNNRGRIDELKGVLKTTLNELVFLECPREEIMSAIRETALTQKGETDI